jgi:hypothetical protein
MDCGWEKARMRTIQVLLAVVLLLQAYIAVRPQPGRFVNAPGELALDTATGHWCAPSPTMVNKLLPECRK